MVEKVSDCVCRHEKSFKQNKKNKTIEGNEHMKNENANNDIKKTDSKVCENENANNDIKKTDSKVCENENFEMLKKHVFFQIIKYKDPTIQNILKRYKVFNWLEDVESYNNANLQPLDESGLLSENNSFQDSSFSYCASTSNESDFLLEKNRFQDSSFSFFETTSTECSKNIESFKKLKNC